jgi:hypothetical protein
MVGADVEQPLFELDETMAGTICSARDWDGKDYLRIIPRVVW